MCWSLNAMICESRARIQSQSCRVRSGMVFISRGRPYLHILLYKKLYVEVSERAVPIWDRRVLGIRNDNSDMLENMLSHRLDVSCWIFRTLPCISFLFMFKCVIYVLMPPLIYRTESKKIFTVCCLNKFSCLVIVSGTVLLSIEITATEPDREWSRHVLWS
jgi:hypothetical protein